MGSCQPIKIEAATSKRIELLLDVFSASHNLPIARPEIWTAVLAIACASPLCVAPGDVWEIDVLCPQQEHVRQLRLM